MGFSSFRSKLKFVYFELRLLSLIALSVSIFAPAMAAEPPAAGAGKKDTSPAATPPAQVPAVQSGVDSGAPSAAPPPPASSVAPSSTPATSETSAVPAVEAPKPKPKPGDMPPPPGMDAAVKLYSAKKWPDAQKAFEKFIKDGTADVSTHQDLAYCYYYQHQYTKAIGQFDWVAKYASKFDAKRAAETTARTIRCYKAGICPQNCIKANDPGWHRLEGHEGLWLTFAGGASWSEHHIGELIQYKNGAAVNVGTCPTCNGTGKVPVLKEGAPPPR